MERYDNWNLFVSGIMIIIAFTIAILFYKWEINVGVLIGIIMAMFTIKDDIVNYLIFRNEREDKNNENQNN